VDANAGEKEDPCTASLPRHSLNVNALTFFICKTSKKRYRTVSLVATCEREEDKYHADLQ
jgi:hypothetical protein